jgi:hypothetical protein
MNTTPPNTERWKGVVLVLTLINTIFAAGLSGFQVDADIRANQANRDSQYYAALASSELVRQGHQSSYDFQTFTDSLKASQEALIFEFTALSLEQNGNQTGAENFHTQSLIAQARADAARKFSILYSDPRYVPDQPDGMPNAEAYITDHADIANEIVTQQNVAADEYQKWNKKSDAYTAVLTLLAIVFFLLGVAQSTQRMRPFFALSASIIMLISIAWSILIVIR